MPPIRPTEPTSLDHLKVMLTDDGSRTLSNIQLGETYHSGCGAMAESWFVYVQNSGIADLLSSDPSRKHSDSVRVLEYGFGTGMTWLLTAAWAAAHHAKLEYVALENTLLPLDVYQSLKLSQTILHATQANLIPAGFDSTSEIESKWFEFRKQISSDVTGSFVRSIDSRSSLKLVIGDAAIYPTEPENKSFDAIYFDAFSPATNPSLWTRTVFERARRVLKPEGRLVSYCVSGAVRRELAEAGFRVTRVPGPVGGKREVLIAFNSNE